MTLNKNITLQRARERDNKYSLQEDPEDEPVLEDVTKEPQTYDQVMQEQILYLKNASNSAFLNACEDGNIQRIQVLLLSPFLDNATITEGRRFLEELRPRWSRHTLILDYLNKNPVKVGILTF